MRSEAEEQHQNSEKPIILISKLESDVVEGKPTQAETCCKQKGAVTENNDSEAQAKEKFSRNDKVRGWCMVLLLLSLGLFLYIKRITNLVDILFLVTAVNSINQAILDFFESKKAKSYISAVTRVFAVVVLFIAYLVSR